MNTLPASRSDSPASDPSYAVGMERFTLVHAGVLLLFASWAFGGNARWAENVIMVVGGSGVVVTLIEFRRRVQAHQSLQPLAPLIPILIFTAIVVLGALRPSFSASSIEGATVFIPNSTSSWLPSSARPAISLRALMLLLAVFVPCFNLSIAVRSRRALLRLLLVTVVNGVILAVFGSLQKLMHAPGLFFGAVHSPNARFFASFIYQNHWGAFALLTLATGWGLFFRGRSESRYRSFLQSPAFLALVGLVLLTASIPLSASRSCTVLAALLSALALAHGLRRLVLHRSRSGRSIRTLVALIVLVAVAVGAAIYQLAWPVMESRLADTRHQLEHLQETHSLGSRAELYRDTWSMARDRFAFGWGLGTYPSVFTLYNKQVSIDRLPVFFEDAHSDWLQLLAETGIVGMLSIAAAIAFPLRSLWNSRPLGMTPVCLLVGCVIILLYALVEFPFGNHAVVLSFWLSLFSGARLAQLDARDRGI